MFVNSFTVLLLSDYQNNKVESKWWLYSLCISLQSLFFSSKSLSSISFDGNFKAWLVPTCKMMLSGLCHKIGFALPCMSLTLAPEKLLTLTLHFWDRRPGCRHETTQSPGMEIVFTIARCHIIWISFTDTDWWLDGFISIVCFRWIAVFLLYCKYFSWLFFEIQSSVLRLI